MIITIDTSKDSHEDLKKLIKFLQHHIGENVYSDNTRSDDFPTPPTGMFDMFGDDNNTNSGSLSDVESLLREEPVDDQDKDEPEEKLSIMPY